ncbi:hypothetical protein G210_4234 [Candida maltosa Xu316]|uniref:Conserved oligomeric Golgi complex subunit 1 n=1 Tax=Candida maltosa (strain Xu316) TaxID=1245528 RepID=M3HEG4_CANMX|nr:hypothetical protein G210_4234 [Candida maltosa Xu316]
MTDTSRRQSHSLLIEDDGETYSNVDEVFTKLNVSQIQQLTKKYKGVIESTKVDLHNLVGSKYRDLIKIAENIDDMYSNCNEVDSKIQQLSYNPTKFVSVYHDNFGKFDSYLRQQKSCKARKESRSIILRNVINKKLNKLNSKIKSGNSPLVHTSNFIYYAKVYYTIENTFKDIIDKDESISQQFYLLKQNLKTYLESEMSRYNLPESIVHTNDKFKTNQRMNVNDLVMKNSQILLQDDLDIEYEDESDELDQTDEIDNAFEVDESVNSKLESYDRNTSVISNYLISYAILCDRDVSVPSKFVNLRIQFMENMLQKLKSDSTLDQINFYQVFKYLEHTCQYVDNYFGNKSSDYYRILAHVTKPWSATALIGHKVWIEDKSIEFANHNKSEKFDRDAKFQSLVDLIFKFTSDTLPIEHNYQNLSLTIFVLHNFLISLKKLQDSVEISGSDSKLIATISQTKHLQSLLSKVSSFINSSYTDHVTYLTKENGVSSLLEKTLNDDLSQCHNYQLFTSELVDLMDVNVEKYLQTLSGDQQGQESVEVIGELKAWFDKCTKYNDIVKLTANSSSVTKLDEFKCVSHTHSQLNSVSWGDFTIKDFDDEFVKLSNTMNDLLWDQISKLLDIILEFTQDITAVDKIIFVIGIINQLKVKISSLNSSKAEETNKTIDSLSNQLFEKLVNGIPSDDFYEFVEESVSECVDLESNDIPVRPTMKIVSGMYKLAKTYLEESEKSNNLDVFSNPEVKQIFIKNKINWVLETLISDKFVSYVSSKIDGKKVGLQVATEVDKESAEEPEPKETSDETSTDAPAQPEDDSTNTKQEETNYNSWYE